MAPFTAEQRQLLQEAIASNPALSGQKQNSDGAHAVAKYLNQISDKVAWRTALALESFSGKALDWSAIADWSDGQARVFNYLTQNGSLNLSIPNVRTGLAVVFPNGGDAAILNEGKRQATHAEALLAAGAGTNEDPAILSFEGSLTVADVEAIRV